MATLESNNVHKVLAGKMGCEKETKRDHDWYLVIDRGQYLSRTCLSKGSKETLSDRRVSEMAKQIGLGTTGNFVKFVSCTLEKEPALAIIRASVGVVAPAGDTNRKST
jgi:hypothetical protein